MNEVKERFGAPEKAAALRKNLKQFVDNVKWSRYEVKCGRGLWEYDGGIRRIVKIPVKALVGEAADPDAFLTAWEEAGEARQFESPVGEPIEVAGVSGDTVELHIGQYPAGSVTEAAAGTAAERADEAKIAAAEIVAEDRKSTRLNSSHSQIS